MVNPTPLLFGGRPTVRKADGCGATERWRKPRPPCNEADRSCNITPPRKRADAVVRLQLCRDMLESDGNARKSIRSEPEKARCELLEGSSVS